ncbi:MAG TPA: 2-phosphosulfolactate phosphatase [Bacteroidales bacterium]|nr:2-phosphosulfolactate phosphatase [Bacteroidales bacterium]HQK69949.1 2-phosphosulfolactate phosphatase [Bacteroidales bacterium]
MKIKILEFVEGAQKADGVTVVIDVFRAFSVSCYAFDAGVREIIVTDSIDEAFRLKERYKESVLAGERDEKKIAGFDLGNSPTEILLSNLSGKILIQTTTAGTRGLLSAYSSTELLTGSLVNASAVARYIKKINPETVSLVAMGYRGKTTAEEDILCAEFIADRISGGTKDFSEKIRNLCNTSGKRFFIPENSEFSPPTDFFLCTMIDRFDFVLKAIRRLDGNISLVKTEIE